MIGRLVTAPRGCGIAGAVTVPDERTMLVNIQHPGETFSERDDPNVPQAESTRPAARRADGPVIRQGHSQA